MLGACIRWYRAKGIKSDLDYRSPLQYCGDLGLLAAQKLGPGFLPQSRYVYYSARDEVAIDVGGF